MIYGEGSRKIRTFIYYVRMMSPVRISRFQTVVRGCACLCAALLPLQSFAQGTDLPGSADPARTRPDITAPAERMRSLEDQTIPGVAMPVIPEGAEDNRFILGDIRISGMTAYGDADVRALYNSYIGKEISVATLFEIMTALHNKYLRDGYTLTRVYLPVQEIDDGIAEISVVEGYVSQVDLAGDLRHDPVIEDAVERILSMKPLSTLKLERLLLVLNDLPYMKVSAILATLDPDQPGYGVPGAVRLVLQNTPAGETAGSIAVNNYGSVFAGPYQVLGEAYIHDIAQTYGTLALQTSLATSLPEQKFLAASYDMPVFGASGASVRIGATWAQTEPGSNLDVLDIKGRSKSIAAGISYPVIKQRGEILNVDTGIELKNSATDIIGDRLYDDRLRVINAGLGYTASDSLYGVNMLDLHIFRGLDILGIRKAGSEDLSREDGRPEFTKMTFLGGRLQALPRNFELYTLVSGQYAWDPLLSGEEIGFGGESFGRGYNPSEMTGDRGLMATFELRRNMEAGMDGVDMRLQPYIFYDLGKVWNIDFNDTTHMSGASTGLGTRINIQNQWDVDLGLAFPLTRPSDNPPKYSGRYGPRFLLELRRSF